MFVARLAFLSIPLGMLAGSTLPSSSTVKQLHVRIPMRDGVRLAANIFRPATAARVPAILVSPWVPKGTVVPGPGESAGRTFEHASIPRTVTNFFIGDYPQSTPREQQAATFLDLLTDTMRPDADCPVFGME